MKDFFRITCYILVSAAAVVGATTWVAKYYDDQALRLEIRAQHEDDSIRVGLAVERALTRFAMEKTDARFGAPLEWDMDRTPIGGQKGAFLYTVRFVDREFVREAMAR